MIRKIKVKIPDNELAIIGKEVGREVKKLDKFEEIKRKTNSRLNKRINEERTLITKYSKWLETGEREIETKVEMKENYNTGNYEFYKDGVLVDKEKMPENIFNKNKHLGA